MKRTFLLAALVVAFAGMSHAGAAEIVDRDIPTQGAATLRLNASGTVRIIPTSGLRTIKLHVANFGQTPPLRVTTSKSSARLTVSITGPSQSILPFVGASGYELQVSIPANMKLDLREFAGTVHIDRVTAPMQIYNANGPIVVDSASSPLTAEADLGDVTVNDAHAMLELSCGTGNVTATLAPNWNGKLVRMESSQGNLTLGVPAGFRASFDVTSADGKVANALRSTPHAPLVFMLTQQGNVAVDVSPKS
jgi:hypothetical protein